jgi:hypothetical protein
MWEVSNAAQFWMSWGAQIAVAIGTVGAVLVALFGQGFRAKFFPPQLSLTLADPYGEKTKVRLTWVENDVEKERWEDARYYRLCVSNDRRWSPANQVQVALMRVEELTAGGALAVSWAGDVPLTWKHQQLYPVLRTVGPASDVDLCTVVKGKWLQLHPLIVAHSLAVVRRGPTKLVLSVQAQSNECESNVLRVAVSWDGNWHDGAQEMTRHLTIKVVDDAVA